ncbi:MAG TPA: glycine zipper 2TM domain-containing protein [Allosphingosinicella sp.]|nr:glycine zipper 2TM domain-containing protein [Allosphingosinicella sp.]
MRKMILALSAATLALPVLPAAPAFAHDNRGYSGQTWRGSDGRTYCRKSNGTTGLLVGGAAGVLAGRHIDSRGDRTTGTVLGAAVGALVGRHLQRNVVSPRRCG